jgi:hypothetical protein
VPSRGHPLLDVPTGRAAEPLIPPIPVIRDIERAVRLGELPVDHQYVGRAAEEVAKSRAPRRGRGGH